jgi:hypothetical protein
MDVAPPPTGSRIQELGDRLIVSFRPRRQWGGLVFLSFWLVGWTIGGIAAFTQLAVGSWGVRMVMLLWLCGWAFGEGAVVLAIAWELRGRELLIVTPERLEVRRQIGRFARTKLYDAALVRNVEAARVPHDEDEKPRKDFCLKVLHDDTTLRVGEGMSEREAEYVTSVVLQRIRPRSWWGEDEPAVFATVPSPETASSARGRVALRNLVFPAVVIGVLVWLGVATLTGRHGHSSSQPTTTAAAPSADPFAAARTYASASTAYALGRAQTLVIGLPTCRLRGTSRKWMCTVRARASAGPFAGRTMLYRCSSVMSGGVLCGPAHQPPVGG